MPIPKVRLILAAMITVALMTTSLAWAAGQGGELRLIPAVEGYPAGKAAPVLLLWRLPQGMSAQGAQAQVALTSPAGVKVAQVHVKASQRIPHAAAVVVQVEVAADTAPAQTELAGTAKLIKAGQAEVTTAFKVPFTIMAADGQPRVASKEMLAKLLGNEMNAMAPAGAQSPAAAAQSPPAPAPAPAPPKAPVSLWGQVKEVISGAFEGGGEVGLGGLPFWVVLALAFLTGLVLNATPCVYPLIPITVSFFGGRSGGGKGSLALQAIAYWAGLAAMYTALGAFAALTGGLIGEALTNPLVLGAIAVVFLALAASMFGFWELRMPARLNTMAAANRTGVMGTFLMGLLVGILAAPCVGPVVVAFIALVAASGDVLYGIAVFFFLSAGLGLPLAVLAFFSGSLNRLPGAGDWMVWVRALFGVILVAMALFVLRPLMPASGFFWSLAFVCLAGGVYLGFIQPSGGPRFKAFKRVMGILIILAPGLLWGMGVGQAPPVVSTEHWTHFSRQAVASAEGKPVMVLFTADWCQPCRELKSKTLPDPRVQEALKGFVLLKADVTDGPDAEAQPFVRQWMVRGVPTIIFLDQAGKIMPEFTMVGFVPPGDMVARLKAAKKRSAGGEG